MSLTTSAVRITYAKQVFPPAQTGKVRVLVCSFSTAAVRNIFSFLRQILRILDNYHLDILIIVGPMTKKMLHRLPLMENAQIRYMTNGPESFTPDSRYLLGEVPEVGTAVATNFIQRP